MVCFLPNLVSNFKTYSAPKNIYGNSRLLIRQWFRYARIIVFVWPGSLPLFDTRSIPGRVSKNGANQRMNAVVYIKLAWLARMELPLEWFRSLNTR